MEAETPRPPPTTGPLTPERRKQILTGLSPRDKADLAAGRKKLTDLLASPPTPRTPTAVARSFAAPTVGTPRTETPPATITPRLPQTPAIAFPREVTPATTIGAGEPLTVPHAPSLAPDLPAYPHPRERVETKTRPRRSQGVHADRSNPVSVGKIIPLASQEDIQRESALRHAERVDEEARTRRMRRGEQAIEALLKPRIGIREQPNNKAEGNSARAQIVELAQKNPKAIANVLSEWLTEDTGKPPPPRTTRPVAPLTPQKRQEILRGLDPRTKAQLAAGKLTLQQIVAGERTPASQMPAAAEPRVRVAEPALDEQTLRTQLHDLYTRQEELYPADFDEQSLALEAQLSRLLRVSGEGSTDAVRPLLEKNRTLVPRFIDASFIETQMQEAVEKGADDLIGQALSVISEDHPDHYVREAYEEMKKAYQNTQKPRGVRVPGIGRELHLPGHEKAQQAHEEARERFMDIFNRRIGFDPWSFEQLSHRYQETKNAFIVNLEDNSTQARIEQRLRNAFATKNRTEAALLREQNVYMENAVKFLDPLLQRAGIFIVPVEGEGYPTLQRAGQERRGPEQPPQAAEAEPALVPPTPGSGDATVASRGDTPPEVVARREEEPSEVTWDTADQETQERYLDRLAAGSYLTATSDAAAMFKKHMRQLLTEGKTRIGPGEDPTREMMALDIGLRDRLSLNPNKGELEIVGHPALAKKGVLGIGRRPTDPDFQYPTIPEDLLQEPDEDLPRLRPTTPSSPRSSLTDTGRRIDAAAEETQERIRADAMRDLAPARRAAEEPPADLTLPEEVDERDIPSFLRRRTRAPEPPPPPAAPPEAAPSADDLLASFNSIAGDLGVSTEDLSRDFLPPEADHAPDRRPRRPPPRPIEPA